MEKRTRRLGGWLASGLVVALLAPSLALLLPDCAVASGAACADGAPTRCAGLWSSRCCDFGAPPAKQTPTVNARTLQAVHAAIAIAPTLPDPLLVTGPAAASRSEGGGADPFEILETTLLRL